MEEEGGRGGGFSQRNLHVEHQGLELGAVEQGHPFPAPTPFASLARLPAPASRPGWRGATAVAGGRRVFPGPGDDIVALVGAGGVLWKARPGPAGHRL